MKRRKQTRQALRAIAVRQTFPGRHPATSRSCLKPLRHRRGLFDSSRYGDGHKHRIACPGRPTRIGRGSTQAAAKRYRGLCRKTRGSFLRRARLVLSGQPRSVDRSRFRLRDVTEWASCRSTLARCIGGAAHRWPRPLLARAGCADPARQAMSIVALTSRPTAPPTKRMLSPPTKAST